MNLPDYSRCIEINQLLVAMGVTRLPELPEVRFEREIVQPTTRETLDPADVTLGERLLDSAIPVSHSEIDIGPDELLEYRGRKVVAYIRDQKWGKVDFYRGRSGYKYHLCNCTTLQIMKDHGREKRYLVTRRQDGQFKVYDVKDGPVRKGIVAMDLCNYCRELLLRKGMYPDRFRLKDFFDRYDSYVPKTIRRIEEVKQIQTYTPQQGDYSREYRKASGYKCQLCKVDCSMHTRLLHLHHRDGDPSNNAKENLQVLCVDCHAHQPLHQRMFGRPGITKIQELRREQDLLTVT